MRALAVSGALCASVALAGLTGEVSATGQVQVLDAQQPGGTTRQSNAALLSENLSLHYAGMPFGPSVAMLAAGLHASNLNLWSDAGAFSARTASADLSVGLLPRRAVPVRLYVRGTLAEGAPQFVPTLGGRESLAFGANVNLEPGGWTPGVRADFDEQHFTAPGAAELLGDLRRAATLTLSRPFGAHRVSLGVRFDQEHRALSGDWSRVGVDGQWLAPNQQLTLSLAQIDRLPLVSPLMPAATRERQGRVEYGLRWSPQLATQLQARVGDATFAAGTGALGSAGVGVQWRPWLAHELTIAGSGDVGFAQTSGAGTSSSLGGALRLGYGRPVGPLKLGAAAGATTQWCSCVGLSEGLLSSVELSASVGTWAVERLEARADYRFSAIDAPMGRGGRRLEHHVSLFSRLRVTSWGHATLTAGYDDGFRDYVDVTASLASLHEQALFVSAAFTFSLARGTATVEARHSRGSAVLPAGSLVQGSPLVARTVTGGTVTALVPISPRVDATLGTQAAWTTLDAAPPLANVGVQAGVAVRLGRITVLTQYQLGFARAQELSSTQHFIRLTLTRPFEVF
ncbi:MAG: hypothetical protein ACOZQL_36185 [Myxococcota bacterium]